MRAQLASAHAICHSACRVQTSCSNVRLSIEETNVPDAALGEYVIGFPLLPTLPPVRYSFQDRPPKPWDDALEVSQLRANRRAVNEIVLAGVRVLPFSDDVLKITQEGAALGFMTEPVPLEAVCLEDITLTRRIPVRELRSKGWRTRTVDHSTESLINGATFPSDRVQHDTVDVLLCILLMLF